MTVNKRNHSAHLLDGGKNETRLLEAVGRAWFDHPETPTTPSDPQFRSVIAACVEDFAAGAPKPWRTETKRILADKLETALNRATIRMIVEREREAFAKGVRWPAPDNASDVEIERAASEEFPHEVGTVPRVVNDPHRVDVRWRYITTGTPHFETSINGGAWVQPTEGRRTPTPKRVAMWADLLTNPTAEATEGTRLSCGCSDNGVTIYFCPTHRRSKWAV